MMLGNLGVFLLAPFLATSSFMGFGANDGYTFANVKQAAAQSNDWRDAFERRAPDRDNYWNWGNRAPRISDISPNEGDIGTEVTLSGARFDEDSVVRFGQGVINDTEVSDDGRSLTFTVPADMGQYCPPERVCTAIAHEVEPGDYRVRVVSDERTSNAVRFTVTEEDGDPTGELAIDSIDGPTSLDVDQEGTWTVNVSGADSDLRYSVKWGDEGMMRSLLANFDEDEGQASATFTHVYGEAGQYTPEFTVIDADGNEVVKSAAEVTVGDDGSVHIDAIEPATTTAGSKVTLTGSGFDGDTKVWVGRQAASDVEVQSDSELSFTVPAIAAGSHRVIVVSDEGRSNRVSLEVEKAVKARVSINGIDAPNRLSVDEEGTWTVHAASNLEGNLSYSVDWGEDNLMMARRSSGLETQSSATFTHSYVEAGTYHPKFTVTDEKGNKASVSASVIVR